PSMTHLGIVEVSLFHCRKRPVERVLFRHHVELNAEPVQDWLDDNAASAVNRSVDYAQRFRSADDTRIKNQSLEPLHIGVVQLFANGRHLSLFLRRKRDEVFVCDCIYSPDDST